jgi:hypothetical protein
MESCSNNASLNPNNSKDIPQQSKITPTQNSMSDPAKTYTFSEDSILVVLRIDSSSSNEIGFDVAIGKKTFQGLAKLVLLEDNGKFYVPEATARIDTKTNRQYFCDSTYNYVSEKINFVFAIENRTKKRLSFIVNNSVISEVNDNIYTLYRR